jgi:hypothetical protein
MRCSAQLNHKSQQEQKERDMDMLAEKIAAKLAEKLKVLDNNVG